MERDHHFFEQCIGNGPQPYIYLGWKELGCPELIAGKKEWDFSTVYPSNYRIDLDKFRGFLLDAMAINEKGLEYEKYSWMPCPDNVHFEWPFYYYMSHCKLYTREDKFVPLDAQRVKLFPLWLKQDEWVHGNRAKKVIASYREELGDEARFAIVIDQYDIKAIRQIIKECIRYRTVHWFIPYTGEGQPLYGYRDIIASKLSSNENSAYMQARSVDYTPHFARLDDPPIEYTPLFIRQIELGKICGPAEMNLINISHFLTTDLSIEEYLQEKSACSQNYILSVMRGTFDKLFPPEALVRYSPLTTDEIRLVQTQGLRSPEKALRYDGLYLSGRDGEYTYRRVLDKDLRKEDFKDMVLAYRTAFVKHYLLGQYLDRMIEIYTAGIEAGQRRISETWVVALDIVLWHELCPEIPNSEKISQFCRNVTVANRQIFDAYIYKMYKSGSLYTDASCLIIEFMRDPANAIWGIKEFVEPIKDHYSLRFEYEELTRKVQSA